MFSNWTIVTAGLGSSDYLSAANRIKIQAERGGFKNIFLATNENIQESCPRIEARYPNIFNAKNPGFGFWTYKPELLLNEFSKRPHMKSGVIWIDSGCELNLNFMSKIRLSLYMLVARLQGAVVFTLNIPEISFTKRKLFALFPHIDPINSGKQIQATWFLLYGEKGRTIASKWLEIILIDKSCFDNTFDINEEHSLFLGSRHDQSIFSLVCKDVGVIPVPLPPPSGVGGLKSRSRAYFHPIWVSRNRTGKSII